MDSPKPLEHSPQGYASALFWVHPAKSITSLAPLTHDPQPYTLKYFLYKSIVADITH